jgi:hypothetical protein
MSYLMTLIDVRKDLVNAINRIDAYETLCVRMEWGTEDTSEKQLGAFHTVCARVIQAYNRLDLNASDREKLLRLNDQLRTENIALKTLAERQREQLAHLNAAMERMVMQGRAA